jgi:hypothetical protein
VKPWYDDDEQLFSELRQALSPEPLPGIEQAAKALFTWRTIDDDLASLAFDSALEPDSSDVRGDPPDSADSAVLRTLTFTTSTVTIEIGIRLGGLLGQLVPPQPGTVEVRTDDGTFGVVAIDDLGCFTVLPAPQVPFRLYLETTSGIRAVTTWLRI